MVNITRRSVLRHAPSIAVVGVLDDNGNPVRPRQRHIDTAWNAAKPVGDRVIRRHLSNKSTRKARAAEERAVALKRNRDRIAFLKGAGLPLPGQDGASRDLLTGGRQ